MNILESIHAITASLAEGKWEDHSPQMLISAQGKLSVYQSNLGAMVANARKEMDTLEMRAKHYEAEQFLSARASGESIQSAQALSRVEAFNHWTRHYDAKARHDALKSDLNALQGLVVAAQVTIRELKSERDHAGYQNNA